MAVQVNETSFELVMAARSTDNLLAVLRARHEYLPEAIAAALVELKRRNVSGFDISNAMDDGDDVAKSVAQAAQLTLPTGMLLLWLLLPFLALTPIGARYYHIYSSGGYRRRTLQFLEVTTIGFTAYMILLLVVLNWW